ncbi:TasA family protein [Nocardioides sp. SYSU D00038]|uniref:TasA family protein n=1 Tax=Nocardioides sp. SYSU D00038 TaxID=2812554 RepID=UPI00196841D5|nr:TasA family protein [Nocardioides sp. SYSU D00038]
MTKHRPPARRRAERPRRSGRARALLSLGVVAALSAGLSVKGTFAFWTDSATITTGSFSSGTLDITLNNLLTGEGGTTSLPSFTLSAMVPGESIAASFPVGNAGSVPLVWTAGGTATGSGQPHFTFHLFSGTAANSGTAAAGNRSGTCSGAALGTTQVLPAPTTPPAAPVLAPLTSTGRTLAQGASENVCVVVALPAAADNNAQGKTVNGSLTFNAKQVGAP